MTKAIRCFSNVTLLPLPPYFPELNPVEQLWQQIKQRFLSNTTFQNYERNPINMKATMLPISKYKLPIQNILIYTKFKKQLN
jgi:transposase